MPGENLRLRLRLTADGQGFVGEVRVAERELRKLTRAVDRSGPAARRAARDQIFLTRTVDRTGKTFLEAHGHHVRYLSGFAGAFGVQQFAAATLRLADAQTRVTNAVRLATDSEAQFLRVRRELFEVAQRSRAPIEAVADLYRQVELSADELGASEERLLALTEGVTQALAINGTSAAQASGSLRQLSQALARGTVQAEEFNSIQEGLLPILSAVAENLDAAGGSVATLRNLVIEGEVSSREFFEALERGLPGIQAAFDDTASTIGQAMTNVRSSLIEVTSAFEEQTGLFESAAEGIGGVASAIREIDPRTIERLAIVGGSLAAVYVTSLTPALGAWIYGLATARYEQFKALGSLNNMTRATTAARVRMLAGATAARRYGRAVGAAAATTRVFGRAVRLALGPLGLLWLAVEAGVALFGRGREEMQDFADGLDLIGDSAESAAEHLRDLNREQREIVERRVAEELAAAQSELAAAEAGIEDLRRRQAELATANFVPGAGLTALGEAVVGGYEERIDEAIEGTIELQRRVADLRRQSEAVSGGIEILSEEELSGIRGGGRPDDGRDEAEDEERAARLLAIQRRLATEREGVELDYQRNLAEIRATAHGAELAELERRAAEIRDASLASIDEREGRAEAAAAEAQAAALAEQAAAARNAADALALLRSENALLAAGGPEALAQLEREREVREELARIAQEHALAGPDVVAQLQSETLAQRELTEVLELQAEVRARLMQRTIASLELLPDVIGGVEESTESTRTALSVTGEALRNITGGLGQFAGASARAFRLHQAAALATAIVSTASGVAQTLGDETIKPTPLKFVLAGAIAAAGALQIAAIKAQEPPRAYRYGGVIYGRREFEYAGGRGVAGEAGPEAILPLRRGPGGRLGVEAAGGGRATVIQVSVDVGGVQVEAPRGADGAEMGRAAVDSIRRALEPAIRDVLVSEQRPGGVLNRADRV